MLPAIITDLCIQNLDDIIDDEAYLFLLKSTESLALTLLKATKDTNDEARRQLAQNLKMMTRLSNEQQESKRLITEEREKSSRLMNEQLESSRLLLTEQQLSRGRMESFTASAITMIERAKKVRECIFCGEVDLKPEHEEHSRELKVVLNCTRCASVYHFANDAETRRSRGEGWWEISLN